eukprot:3477247-Prymnesium_polylepis.1
MCEKTIFHAREGRERNIEKLARSRLRMHFATQGDYERAAEQIELLRAAGDQLEQESNLHKLSGRQRQ